MVQRKKASRSRPMRNPNPRDFVNLEKDLYQEASNLSAITGDNIAVICRRPSGDVRVWGYPSAHAVISRYQRYSRREIPTRSFSPLDARGLYGAEIRRRKNELNGTLAAISMVAEEIEREQELMVDSLSRELKRVQKMIAEAIDKNSEAKSLTDGFTAEAGA